MAGEGWQARMPFGIAGGYRGPYGVRGADHSQGSQPYIAAYRMHMY